ncbi:Retrovirus-related Pol polyprotein from transposon RE1 [Vitis vinifera]|uniref:Retrovirus-related Pol polyprotein from transposon RE1 n=1 Tax=Vitis vinifera TaxID=29760 RepID=A0A438D7U3_VITVI|nr:Retrovirus-related Pol polyprotein from transposon RE1 [Vitis vinifera]
MQYYSGRVVKPDQTKLGSTKPNTSYVCYLHKTLCGLKKAPRAWFHKLNTSLTTWGFESSCADTSLFFKHATSDVLILVYVDDILVTGSCASQVTFFISQLSSTFALRDLGSLYYFFGIGVTHSTDSLHLCQQKYVHDLLTLTAITDTKLVLTLGSLAWPSLSLSLMVIYFISQHCWRITVCYCYTFKPFFCC